MKDLQKNINEAPIGIFDSGLGGLSICREIVNLMPNESIVYLADSKNAPYGEKSKNEIIKLSVKNVELLLEMGCKIIVVACNTATTNAISELRSSFDVPIIGIEPATKPAALQTKSGKIGVLATEGTLKSELFLSTSEQFRDSLEIIEVKGIGLVRLIESGRIEETEVLLKEYLYPLVQKGVDNIVLGCTHYPFLIPIIKKVIPESITIIDSGAAVAKQTQLILGENNRLNNKSDNSSKCFYTNKDIKIFKRFISEIELKSKEVSYKEF
ncbi:MAG: glutamate racemase [Vicingaceae bacterium]